MASSSAAGQVHHITDYARPRLPLPMRLANAIGGPLARVAVSLDEGTLLSTAEHRAGASDFGDDGFREPLAVYLRALTEEASFSPLGRFLASQLVIQLLTTRLRAEALIGAHPEILEQELRAPIVIIGLPRTGTTHLHSLIASNPALRSLPYWESLEPVPPQGEEDDPAPRIARCERALRIVHYAMPLFPLMHEMTPHAPHEEVQILALDFRTMLFEATNYVPSYRDWYCSSDQTSGYRTLRRMLLVMQWLRGGRRWVLKSPQHLEQLGPLLAVFPDAKIVQTHRDPVHVTASMTTLAAYGMRMGAGGIDAREVGRYWAARIEHMLTASVRDRALIPPEQVLDVRFHEFMADDLATVERVYAFAGEPLTPEARDAMQAYLTAHPRGVHGRVEYNLADFGIDAAERRSALRHYQERFDIPDD